MSAWKAGKVQWFDDIDGRGMILDLDDERMFYVNYRAIKTENKWKTLQENQEVEFKLFEDSTEAFIKEVREC